MPIYIAPPPPPTIRDWDGLPYSLISSAEMSDDCVFSFTSGLIPGVVLKLIKVHGQNVSRYTRNQLVSKVV